jgi:hypothetical protein
LSGDLDIALIQQPSQVSFVAVRMASVSRHAEHIRYSPHQMNPQCHVWTAAALQEESDIAAIWFEVRSCIRPVIATALAAGHDVIRGSGPNQRVALFPRVTLCGFSRSNGSTISHQRVITPTIRKRYADMP